MLAARDESLARAVGVSNYSTAQIDELIQATEETRRSTRSGGARRCTTGSGTPSTGTAGWCWRATARSRPPTCDDPVLTEIAEAHGVSPAQVVLRWHIDHEIVVIPKSVTPGADPRQLRRLRLLAHVRGDARIDALGTG